MTEYHVTHYFDGHKTEVDVKVEADSATQAIEMVKSALIKTGAVFGKDDVFEAEEDFI